MMPDVFVLIAVVQIGGIHRDESAPLKVLCGVLTKFEDVEKMVAAIVEQGYVKEEDGSLPIVEANIHARFFPLAQISYFDVFLERRA